MFGVLVAWVFVVGGLIMAMACALNLLGLAPRWLRTDPLGRIQTLGLGMAGGGVAGFFWFFPAHDGPVEAWREYWIWVGAVGLVLIGAPGIWHWFRQGVHADGALFFPRVYMDRQDWRPKHWVILATFAASAFLFDVVPDNGWWAGVTLIWFLVMCNALRMLPFHRGRRTSTANGSAPQS